MQFASHYPIARFVLLLGTCFGVECFTPAIAQFQSLGNEVIQNKDLIGVYYSNRKAGEECIRINSDFTWSHHWRCGEKRANFGKWEQKENTDFGDILALSTQNNQGEYYSNWSGHEDFRMPYGKENNRVFLVFGGATKFVKAPAEKSQEPKSPFNTKPKPTYSLPAGKKSRAFSCGPSVNFNSATVRLVYSEPKGAESMQFIEKILRFFGQRLSRESSDSNIEYRINVGDPTFRYVNYRSEKTGKITFKCEAVFRITIQNGNNEEVTSKSFQLGNGIWDFSSSSKNAALAKTLRVIEKPVVNFAYEAFPIKVNVGEMLDSNRKGRYRKCNLVGGSKSRIFDGQQFEIYGDGRKIGLVYVHTEPTTDLSECKIREGHQELTDYFNRGEKLTAISISP